jgi:hypothetical protein
LPFAEANGKTLHLPMHSPKANDRQRLGFADFNAKAKWQKYPYCANILFFVVKDWANLIKYFCIVPGSLPWSFVFLQGLALVSWLAKNKTLNMLIWNLALVCWLAEMK